LQKIKKRRRVKEENLSSGKSLKVYCLNFHLLLYFYASSYFV
jgi:hypothetical protein